MAPFLLYDCRDGYIYASMGISAGLKTNFVTDEI